MPQVSLYIEQELLDAARRNARLENMSLSKYVSQALAKNSEPGWPKGYWDLFGALKDDSFNRPKDVPFNKVSRQLSFL